MIPTSLIGNSFNIRESPFQNRKTIFYFLLGVFLTSLLGWLLLKESILIKPLLLSSLIGFLVWTFIYTFKNISVIYNSFKEYPLEKKIFYVLIECIITISIYSVWAGIKSYFWFAIIGAYFWLVSGLARIINEKNRLFIEKGEEESLIMLKFYAVNRLSFFFIGLIGAISSETFVQEIYIFVSNLWLLIFFIFSLIYFYFVSTNLIPYILSSSKVKNSLRIIKILAKENSSREKLKQETGLGDNELEILTNNLELTRFIKKEGRKYALGRVYSN